MSPKLRRYYGTGYLHFITTSCYKRRPLLGSAHNRDLLLHVMEQVRRRYHFVVVGYVVMPEHVHLLFSEPERGNPSVVMQALKQGFARRLLRKLRASADPRQGTLFWRGLAQPFQLFELRVPRPCLCALCGDREGLLISGACFPFSELQEQLFARL